MASIKKKKSKKGWIIGLIIVLILGGVVVTPMIMPKTTNYTEATAKRGNIKTYYTFSGDVASKNTQNMMASSVLQISEIKVSEGDKVKKDAVLFKTSQGMEIKSGIAGTISKIYIKKDEQVMAGQQICDIYDFDKLQTTVKVDEYDLSSISKGKKVDVTIGAINKTITGTVSRISDTAVNDNGVSYFTAVINLPKHNAIKVGMTAEAKILNKQAKNVVMVPMKALQFDDEDNVYVQLKNDNGNPTSQYVKVGINDGKWVEIKKGVSLNQVICYIPKTADVSNAPAFGRPSVMR